jgi:iron complex transport system permease protein
VTIEKPFLLKRILTAVTVLTLALLVVMFLGISIGSTDSGVKSVFLILLGRGPSDSILDTIIWQIRLPRVLLAALVGATLSLGGLVFQAG